MATIMAFHPQASLTGEARAQDDARRRRGLRVFGTFFVAVFAWSFLLNTWLQFLQWFPILCWVCSTNTCAVLGEGLLGVSLPGLSLDVSGTFALFPTVLPKVVVFQMLSGAVLVGWIVAPTLYFCGVTVWPSGLRLYTTNQTILASNDLGLYPLGGVYTPAMAASEEPIGLSSSMQAPFALSAQRRHSGGRVLTRRVVRQVRDHVDDRLPGLRLSL